MGLPLDLVSTVTRVESISWRWMCEEPNSWFFEARHELLALRKIRWVIVEMCLLPCVRGAGHGR